MVRPEVVVGDSRRRRLAIVGTSFTIPLLPDAGVVVVCGGAGEAATPLLEGSGGTSSPGLLAALARVRVVQNRTNLSEAKHINPTSEASTATKQTTRERSEHIQLFPFN